jgi:four helix bundle protein
VAKYQYRGQGTNTFSRLPGYKNIAAWQAASDLSWLINGAVSQFGPGHYRLVDQMRGAAISVAANIAEGYCSGSLPNYIRYCNHARGSLGELGSYLQECDRAGLLQGQPLEQTLQLYSTATLLLDRLLRALFDKERTGTWDNSFGVREAQAEYAVDPSAVYGDIGTDAEVGDRLE